MAVKAFQNEHREHMQRGALRNQRFRESQHQECQTGANKMQKSLTENTHVKKSLAGAHHLH